MENTKSLLNALNDWLSEAEKAASYDVTGMDLNMLGKKAIGETVKFQLSTMIEEFLKYQTEDALRERCQGLVDTWGSMQMANAGGLWLEGEPLKHLSSLSFQTRASCLFVKHLNVTPYNGGK